MALTPKALGVIIGVNEIEIPPISGTLPANPASSLMKKLHHIKAWPSLVTRNKFIRKLLRHRIFRKILGAVGPKYIVYESAVGKFYCNLLEHTNVGHFFLKNDHYEPYVTQLMKEYTGQSDDVLDIGANIGYFSILCSQITKGRVYSIEPEPANYVVLQANIRLNKANNIVPLNFAASNANGRINFYVNSQNTGDHRCSMLDDNLSKIIKVDAKRIDQVLTREEFNRIRIIKIDVQGYEKKVFDGMADYLKGAKNLVIISEFVLDLMVSAGDNPRDYLEFINNNGFSLWILDEERHELIEASVDKILNWAQNYHVSNLLFKK